jgi:hypothetical protein
MTIHDRCGKPAIGETEDPFSTNGNYAIYLSFTSSSLEKSFNVAVISDDGALSALRILRLKMDAILSSESQLCQKLAFGNKSDEHFLCNSFRSPCVALSLFDFFGVLGLFPLNESEGENHTRR